MAVRIYATPRPRRETSLPPVTPAPLLIDETVLLDRTEQVIEDIDATLAHR
jgi:hypothetical protein